MLWCTELVLRLQLPGSPTNRFPVIMNPDLRNHLHIVWSNLTHSTNDRDYLHLSHNPIRTFVLLCLQIAQSGVAGTSNPLWHPDSPELPPLLKPIRTLRHPKLILRTLSLVLTHSFPCPKLNWPDLRELVNVVLHLDCESIAISDNSLVTTLMPVPHTNIIPLFLTGLCADICLKNSPSLFSDLLRCVVTNLLDCQEWTSHTQFICALDQFLMMDLWFRQSQVGSGTLHSLQIRNSDVFKSFKIRLIVSSWFTNSLHCLQKFLFEIQFLNFGYKHLHYLI